MGEHVWTSLRRPVAAALLGGALLAAVAGCSIAPAPAPTPSAARTEKTVLDPTTPSRAPSEAPNDGSGAAPSATPAAPVSSATPSAPASAPATPVAAAPDPLKTVHPFITGADWDAGTATIEIGALVPGVVEQGGTCVATVTKGAASRTASGAATATAQSTGCEPLRVSGSDLTTGTWKVVVDYTSARSHGVSAARSVEVAR